ncbi:hypothetical protein PIB30_044294 [Stylosanthes scabra]|uniref:Uncharacterized protein n=1 Tax=Stylosanthes scabra TaxID=79078 RepID=A0ABU6UH54_9FABA|nr:hypothetical protein [Stylosanthes scabra]
MAEGTQFDNGNELPVYDGTNSVTTLRNKGEQKDAMTGVRQRQVLWHMTVTLTTAPKAALWLVPSVKEEGAEIAIDDGDRGKSGGDQSGISDAEIHDLTTEY